MFPFLTIQCFPFNDLVNQAIFAEEDMEVRLEAREKDCFVDLNVVAIGSGGLGRTAGGGSGYVETGTVRVSINDPTIQVTSPARRRTRRLVATGTVEVEVMERDTEEVMEVTVRLATMRTRRQARVRGWT